MAIGLLVDLVIRWSGWIIAFVICSIPPFTGMPRALLFSAAGIAGILAILQDTHAGIHRFSASLPLSSKQLGGIIWIQTVVVYPVVCGFMQLVGHTYMYARDPRPEAWEAPIGCFLLASLSMALGGVLICAQSAQMRFRDTLKHSTLTYGILKGGVLSLVIAPIVLMFALPEDVLGAKLTICIALLCTGLVLVVSWSLREEYWGSRFVCRSAMHKHASPVNPVRFASRPISDTNAKLAKWWSKYSDSLLLAAFSTAMFLLEPVLTGGPEGFLAPGCVIVFVCARAVGHAYPLRAYRTLPLSTSTFAGKWTASAFIAAGIAAVPVACALLFFEDPINRYWSLAPLAVLTLSSIPGMLALNLEIGLPYGSESRRDKRLSTLLCALLLLPLWIMGPTLAVQNAPLQPYAALPLAALIFGVGQWWFAKVIRERSHLYRR